MLSGRDTLTELGSTLRSARKNLEHLERESRATSDSLATNRQQETQALRRMAMTRLDSVRQGEVVNRLDSADYEVGQILEKRQTAIASLNQDTTAARSALLGRERTRDAAHDKVDAAAQRLADREASVQSMLETDAAFQEQLEKSRSADAIAVGAAEKATS